MKTIFRILFVVLVGLITGCQQQRSFTEVEKEAIKKDVHDQFRLLVSAINQLDAGAWSEYYSKESFTSAMVGTKYYAERKAWVDTITYYFSLRDRQKIEPMNVRVTPLSPDLALMTSEEKGEMIMKDGKIINSKHVFSMIWKKEQSGWKITHSHESWIDELVR